MSLACASGGGGGQRQMATVPLQVGRAPGGGHTRPSVPEPRSSPPGPPLALRSCPPVTVEGSPTVAEGIRTLGARGDKLETKRQRGARMVPIAPRSLRDRSHSCPQITLLSEGGSTVSPGHQDCEGEKVHCPQDPIMAREAAPQQLPPLSPLHPSSPRMGEMPLTPHLASPKQARCSRGSGYTPRWGMRDSLSRCRTQEKPS